MWEEIGYTTIPVVFDKWFCESCPDWAAWKWLYMVWTTTETPDPMPPNDADVWQDMLYAHYQSSGYNDYDVAPMIEQKHRWANRLMQLAYNSAADAMYVPESIRHIVAPKQRTSLR